MAIGGVNYEVIFIVLIEVLGLIASGVLLVLDHWYAITLPIQQKLTFPSFNLLTLYPYIEDGNFAS